MLNNFEGHFFALPYGPSGAAPDSSPEEYERYFERLDATGLGRVKRPDLLIFSAKEKDAVIKIVEKIGGVKELPFYPEEDTTIKNLLAKAIMAVECENSLWKAKMMPNYNYQLKPQKRLNGQLGLAKTAVLPTIIMKEEDKGQLAEWQTKNPKVELHLWHAFFDEAYGISFREIIKLIDSGVVQGKIYEFQNAGQSSTKKILYNTPYYLGYKLALSQKEPDLKAQVIVDKNGHIYPYVAFTGGKMKLENDAVKTMTRIESEL